MRLRLLTILAALLTLTIVSTAQLRVAPVAERPDLDSLELHLRKLASTGTFMQTDAHPDDEDNALLALMGLGRGMRTVLVTATRGNGGQNEIGPELFEPLGVLRTEELLAVHRFDRAEQFFTRAIDFGFSFSVEESIQKWGHDEIVGDFVRHIRAVRPDVIAGFLCGGDGGGQHHQASAQLTLEAFRAAADPAKYPDQINEGLHPWQAMRVLCTDSFRAGSQAAMTPKSYDVTTVDVSGFDPILGRTYSELGIEARSMHKCQGTSQLLPLPGQSFDRTYRLRDTVLDPGVEGGIAGAPGDLFGNIDTSIAGLARLTFIKPPELMSGLDGIAGAVRQAAAAASSTGAAAAIPPLAAGLRIVRALRKELPSLQWTPRAGILYGGPTQPWQFNRESMYEIDFRLAQKEHQFADALIAAAGARLEALSDDGIVTPGQNITVSIYASSAATDAPLLKRVALSGLDGVSRVPCEGALAPGKAVTCKTSARVPVNTHYSTPYWTPRKDAARYDFEPDVPFGVPFRPSPFRVTYELTVGGEPLTVEREVQYRYDDVQAGEKRMDLKVVPPFDVRVSPDIAVIPAGSRGSRELKVTISNNQKGPTAGNVALTLPPGWTSNPASARVTFGREDEQATAKFSITPGPQVPSGESTVTVTMTAADGTASSLGYEVIEYSHIHRQHYVEPAATRAKIIDVKIAPNLLVGYIMGVGDKVPQAIEQLGARVEMIDPDMLAFGPLSKYDAIVTGVRAYERRPDLRANNRRLIQYAERGGTVLVQYNKFEFNEAQYGPWPAKVSSNRVTDEHAPIEVLVPDDPVFNRPNKIGPEAWAHWVQERGLYFLGERDSRYIDLVRTEDPFPFNAGKKTGALVEARIGKGRWIYIGLGLWRQLPAGTDGAYRLFANLLSLGKS